MPFLFSDVFLPQSEGFRGVEDEHFHANVRGHRGRGEF